ncbi:hypothetical protein Hanom_Chr07g00641931 [Helianthus anomalus]
MVNNKTVFIFFKSTCHCAFPLLLLETNEHPSQQATTIHYFMTYVNYDRISCFKNERRDNLIIQLGLKQKKTVRWRRAIPKTRLNVSC